MEPQTVVSDDERTAELTQTNCLIAGWVSAPQQGLSQWDEGTVEVPARKSTGLCSKQFESCGFGPIAIKRGASQSLPRVVKGFPLVLDHTGLQ